MRTRNLVIGIVLVVTAAAATIVILYLQGSGGVAMSDEVAPVATAFVSRRDIHKGQKLDPLIEKGVIIDTGVPAGALVVGAVTDLRQLRGSTALVDIRRNEQISANNVEQLGEPAP